MHLYPNVVFGCIQAWYIRPFNYNHATSPHHDDSVQALPIYDPCVIPHILEDTIRLWDEAILCRQKNGVTLMHNLLCRFLFFCRRLYPLISFFMVCFWHLLHQNTTQLNLLCSVLLLFLFYWLARSWHHAAFLGFFHQLSFYLEFPSGFCYLSLCIGFHKYSSVATGRLETQGQKRGGFAIWSSGAFWFFFLGHKKYCWLSMDAEWVSATDVGSMGSTWDGEEENHPACCCCRRTS